YETYPYRESLVTVAQDRGYTAIARLLAEYLARPDLPAIGDSMEITYEKNDTERRFQKLVSDGEMAAVEQLLKEGPTLALDPFAFWSEGILSMPANRRRRDMLDLLIDHGARVPDVTKWGQEYYFKHEDIAAFLIDRGMSACHMNCHHTTLLHDMAC